LGAHPEGGAMVKLMRGRYGPYVTDGSTNATIPRDSDPLSVTLDQAVQLIAERVAKGGGKKPKKAAKKAAAPKPAKDAAPKKPAGKKAAKKPAKKAAKAPAKSRAAEDA
jgi:DNA topoisomerase-1